jgi:hypothetical protein
MGDLARAEPHDLDSLAHEINRQQQLADDHFRTSVQHALHVGALLNKAKARVPHGQWETWVTANTSLAPRTERGYRQLARQHAVTGDGSPLGLRQALAAIAAPASERQGEPPAATTDLSARMRAARAASEQAHPDAAALSDLDAARERLDRQVRRARRRGCEPVERARAWRDGAAEARRLGEMMEALAG